MGFVGMGLCFGAFAALVPALKANVGLSDGRFGTMILIGTLGALVAMWMAPTISRMLGRHGVMICILGMAAAWLLPGLAWNGLGFAVAMVCTGATAGLLDVVMNARVSHLEASSRRPLMNLNHGLFSLAYAVAAISAGLARDAGIGPFPVFVVICAVVAGLSLFSVPNSVGASSEAVQAQGKGALPLMVVFGAGLVTLIAFMSEQATEGWSALFLERQFDVRPALGALGPAVLGLTMAVGRLSGQALAQRFRHVQLILGAACFSAVGMTVAAVSTGHGLTYLGFGLFGLGVSVIAPTALAWAGQVVNDDMREIVISRVTLLGYAGFFIGPPVMGFVSEWNSLRLSFGLMVAALVLIPLVLVPMMRRWEVRQG